MARYLAYPFALGPRLARAGARPQREGFAETDDADAHLRNLILSVLFTAPGERVMRPRFGAGLNRALFQNLSPLARSALEYRIRESLDRDLEADLVLEDVVIEFDPPGGTVLIGIDYMRRSDREPSRLELVL